MLRCGTLPILSIRQKRQGKRDFPKKLSGLLTFLPFRADNGIEPLQVIA
jgi:hypothetical protein